jgi:hypothetical protein
MWIDVLPQQLKMLFMYFTSFVIPNLSQHNLHFKLYTFNYSVIFGVNKGL